MTDIHIAARDGGTTEIVTRGVGVIENIAHTAHLQGPDLALHDSRDDRLPLIEDKDPTPPPDVGDLLHPTVV